MIRYKKADINMQTIGLPFLLYGSSVQMVCFLILGSERQLLSKVFYKPRLIVPNQTRLTLIFFF